MKKKVAFVGREKQLDSLNLLLKKRTSSLVTITGRRRVGKSRLVDEFAKKHKYYSFSGIFPTKKITAQDQRDEFLRQFGEQFDLPQMHMQDWGDIFTMLAKQTSKGLVIILFDEISWMGSKDHLFLGKLKNVWDGYFSKNPELILIVCGSVSSWIDENIIKSTGFFGRISLQIVLDELSIIDSSTLLKDIGFRGSKYECFLLLSVIGGIPWYIEQIKPNLNAVENIRRLCFVNNGLLVGEFDRIFHDIFGERGKIYRNIVKTMIGGSLEFGEICNKTNYSNSGVLAKYLEELILSGFLYRYYTWLIKDAKQARLSKYAISDNFLRFYLKYIMPVIQKINNNIFENISITSMPNWFSIMGLQFENLVLNNRQLIYKLLNLNPSDIVYDNPFFQRSTKRRKGCQIDYMIQTRFKTLYVCEIKFSQNPIGVEIVSEVKQKISRLSIPHGFSVLPVLIHVCGVSNAVIDQDYFLEIIDFSTLLV